MKTPTPLIFAIALCVAASFAHAQEPQTQETPQEAIPSLTAAPHSESNTVPKLNIEWKCGNCQPNEKVPPLIESAYNAAATTDEKFVSETDSVNVEIYLFRQRPPGLRAAFGFMAGKDQLSIRAHYKGRELNARDYTANAWQGMNHLCESVGMLFYQKIATQLE